MTEKIIEPSEVVLGDRIKCQHFNDRSGTLDSSTAVVDRISFHGGTYSFRNKEGAWFGKSIVDEIFFIEHITHPLERFAVGDWFDIDHEERREVFEKHRTGWWIGSELSRDGNRELKMYKEADVRYVYDQWMSIDPDAVSCVTGDGEPE